jgi:hypothetical protein
MPAMNRKCDAKEELLAQAKANGFPRGQEGGGLVDISRPNLADARRRPERTRPE